MHKIVNNIKYINQQIITAQHKPCKDKYNTLFDGKAV